MNLPKLLAVSSLVSGCVFLCSSCVVPMTRVRVETMAETSVSEKDAKASATMAVFSSFFDASEGTELFPCLRSTLAYVISYSKLGFYNQKDIHSSGEAERERGGEREGRVGRR